MPVRIVRGNHAAFDPVTNLRVGVQVLKECIARAGGLEAGLRFYVGAANLQDDGGYAAKVLGEHANLKLVAAGRQLSITVPQGPAVVPARAQEPSAADAPVADKVVGTVPQAAAPVRLERVALLR